MTTQQTPGQTGDPAVFHAGMTNDEIDAEAQRVFGGTGGMVGHILGVQDAHGELIAETAARTDRHGEILGQVITWGDGVNAFGEFQMQLDGNLTRDVGDIKTHITTSQVMELVLAFVVGAILIGIGLWASIADKIGGNEMNHPFARVITAALVLIFIGVICVIVGSWYKPTASDSDSSTTEPATTDGQPTTQMPATRTQPQS